MEREVIKEPTFLFKTIRGHFLGNVVFLIIHKEVVHIVYLAKNLYTPASMNYSIILYVSIQQL